MLVHCGNPGTRVFGEALSARLVGASIRASWAGSAMGEGCGFVLDGGAAAAVVIVQLLADQSG